MSENTEVTIKGEIIAEIIIIDDPGMFNDDSNEVKMQQYDDNACADSIIGNDNYDSDDSDIDNYSNKNCYYDSDDYFEDDDTDSDYEFVENEYFCDKCLSEDEQ